MTNTLSRQNLFKNLAPKLFMETYRIPMSFYI